jgi:hypothetical protein
VGAITVVDCVVQQHLRYAELHEWKTELVHDWYVSCSDAPEAFLLRANTFLRRVSIDGIRVLLKAFKTGSYAVYMKMSSMASLLVFERLEFTKHGCMLNMQGGKADAASATSAGGNKCGRSPLHGFRLCVSSSGRVFKLSDDDMPAPGVIRMTVLGQRCLVHLEAEEWETIGPMLSARECVQAVPCKGNELPDAQDAHGMKQHDQIERILRDVNMRSLIHQYLEKVSEAVGTYDDSVSGERSSVDGEFIPWMLVSDTSFDDK